MTESMCCPPTSEKYLEATYATVGTLQSLPEVEYYQSGLPEGRNVVIIIPDVWGWNSGRTRNVADFFAEAGYCAIVPKLLVPGLRGGTDGDGLPPDFNWGAEGAFQDFGGYMSGFSWEADFKPKFGPLIEYLTANGAKKFVSIGFCWGGWITTHLLIDYGDIVVSGVSPHPSIWLEGKVYGGNDGALCSQIKSPMLLMPAGDDGDTYRPGGEIFDALKAAQPDSLCFPSEFADMKHGWVPRGDVSDPRVKELVELALAEAMKFFARFLA